MSELSLSQAAKLTKKSKSTINRAIKVGKISATRHSDGSYSIDPSELSRVFNVEPDIGSKRSDVELGETYLLERIKTLEAMLDREREVSSDLKEDRDRWRQQATALLSDQSRPAATISRWWPWRNKGRT